MGRPRKSDVPAGKNFLTRREVQRELGISHSGVRAAEDRGDLKPRFVRGLWRFDPAEVAAHAAVRRRLHEAITPGAVCAKCFALFREGKSLADVVIELQVTPDLVRKWKRDYDADYRDPIEPRIVIERDDEEDARAHAEDARDFESTIRKTRDADERAQRARQKGELARLDEVAARLRAELAPRAASK
jgi:hypothetical protein